MPGNSRASLRAIGDSPASRSAVSPGPSTLALHVATTPSDPITTSSQRDWLRVWMIEVPARVGDTSRPARHPRPQPGSGRRRVSVVKVSWALQIVVAVILLQTLFFKFTGAEES